MVDWPDTDELAQVIDVTKVEDWQTTLDRILASAISQVKGDVGAWDEDVDEPDDDLAQAALRLAELIAERPNIGAARLTTDPVYIRLLKGHRRVFGVV